MTDFITVVGYLTVVSIALIGVGAIVAGAMYAQSSSKNFKEWFDNF